jgi:ABC-type transport system involved in cytochrome c biogenesis permease subunit
VGQQLVAIERPEGNGVDSEQKIDVPSAYITLKKKGGATLGTYLVSLWFPLLTKPIPPQKIEVDGKPYEVSLRFKRIYKPYTITLNRFDHDLYVGTDVPKNFSSHVHLIDPARNEERDVEIYMNHPLRHGGETFYQTSFLPGDAGTVLQVVRNPGWLMPYVSCILVALGMLIHFGVHLVGFLRGRFSAGSWKPSKGVQTEIQEPTPSGISRFFPWMAVGVASLYLLVLALPLSESHSKMHLGEFGRIPVVDRGRVKPIDTLARVSLMLISNRQTFIDETDPKNPHEEPAIKWLLDVMASPPGRGGPGEQHKVFRIQHDQVLDLLGLKERSGLRYALSEFAPKLEVLSKEASRAQKVEASQRDTYDQRLIELAEHVRLYIQLAQLETPLAVPPQSAGDEWKSVAQIDEEAQQVARDRIRAEVDRDKLDLEHLTKEQQHDLVLKLQGAIDEARKEINPAAGALSDILRHYEAGEATAFNKAIADYPHYLAVVPDAEVSRAGLEVLFNHFAPFYQCSVLYVLVFVMALVGWAAYTRPLHQAAFWLMGVLFLVHTAALITRMYLQGRPPVTNLYSASVFIGWGCVLFGLGLEWIFRNGIGTAVGSAIGALTLVIAHHLAATGDTLEMMQAVLDTNFWLATHVTCVTFGYASTYVAGFLGMLFILRGVLTRSLNRDTYQALSKMIYGILCFAIFFSFVGTVLGGIWADQSWGRFWGWDPKENGALIIVVWNALILHARWAGLVKQRGIAVLSLVGNIVTAWSFFGVNMLGVGLHSYGFMSGALFWLLAFIGSQVALIGLGLLPLRHWLSFDQMMEAPARTRPRPAPAVS